MKTFQLGFILCRLLTLLFIHCPFVSIFQSRRLTLIPLFSATFYHCSMSTILDIQDADIAYGMNSMAEDKKELCSTVSTKSGTALSKMALLKHSLQYVAPEVIDDYSEDTKRADLWSVGVILYAMTSGFLPFGGILEKKSDTASTSDNPIHSSVAPLRDDEEDHNSFNETVERIRLCEKEPYSDSLSDSLKTLLDGMLTVDPDERYTLYDIKNSEWMENIPEGMEILLEKMEKDVPIGKSSKRKSKTKSKSSSSFFDCLCQPYSAFVAPKRSSTGFDSPYDSDGYSLDSVDAEDGGQEVGAASADDSVQFRSSSSLSVSTDCLNLKDASKEIHRDKDDNSSNLDSVSNSPLKLGLNRR